MPIGSNKMVFGFPAHFIKLNCILVLVDIVKVSGNTVLITGGATGIGLALAEKLLGLGNEVIICGRRTAKLEEARIKLPHLHTRRCDISKENEREELFKWIESNFKNFNVLVNNAGIQKRIDLRKGREDLSGAEDEIEINLRSQIHLSALFIPLLSKRKEAAIINISSGLGFVPMASFPVYSATKAAIHSFTISLRHQLKSTPIKVFEVVPPAVHDTELKGRPAQKTEYSISAWEMAGAIVEGLENERYEISAGAAKKWIEASRRELDEAFSNINRLE